MRTLRYQNESVEKNNNKFTTILQYKILKIKYLAKIAKIENQREGSIIKQ